MTATATPSPTVRGDTVASEAVARYAVDFEAFLEARRQPEPASVSRRRRAAAERFAALGFPHRRQEAWRFTDVSPIVGAPFVRATGAAAVDREAVAAHAFDGAIRLVFVDGFLAPALSELDELPEGTLVGSLAEALAHHPERIEPYLGRQAAFTDHPFTALNTAFFADGACVVVPRNAVVEAPIHLLFLASAGSQPLVAYPRLLLVAEENSQATVVESYAALGGGPYFNCAVTEVVAGPNSVVDHYKVQQEGREGFHVANFQLHQERSSNFSSHSITTGGALTRNDVGAMLAGEGIECTLNGLYVVNGAQHVDNQMRVDHAQPHCNSHELYKGVLDGDARAVFNGLIHVHPGAQKTDAKQTNRNLLLSPGAMANSNPQLEIFADDVRCTHGSTVGQLDEEAVFYLRSRGIGAEAAKSLLTYAFASDIVSRIKVEAVRRDLEEFLFTRLPRGEVVRQAI